MADLNDRIREVMAERYGPPVPDFGPVDGPQRQQILAERRAEAEAMSDLLFLRLQGEEDDQEDDLASEEKETG